MQMRTVSFAFFLIFCAGAVSAETMRCGSNILDVGETKGEAVLKCGNPGNRWNYLEEIRDRGNKSEYRREVEVEEWSYNFGPNDFIYYVTFRNGRISSIRSGGYGYSPNATGNSCRDGQTISVGDTIAEVIGKCGEPGWRDAREDQVVTREHESRERRRTVPREEWTYNFGPQRLVYRISFENGRVRKIETGGYGN